MREVLFDPSFERESACLTYINALSAVIALILMGFIH